MKKNVRKALAISGIAFTIGTSGMALTASADTTSNKWQRSHQERIIRTRKNEHTIGKIFVRRTTFGTVSAISGSTLTIANSSKTFTINTDSSTRLLNRQWKSINFSDIKTGDKIRVFGNLSETTISAKTVRDISQ